ncbi:31482_t:CDS:2, partial [Gigaspora margarita]
SILLRPLTRNVKSGLSTSQTCRRNLFDYYLENALPAFEDSDISPILRSSTEATSSFITPRRPIPSLSNLAASPILRREGTSSLITYRSITTRLEPEDLDDPFSLPHITKILLNSLPSSPLVDIPLRTLPRIPSPTPTTASSPNLLTRFINFITPGRLSNPPPPHQPIRTLTPEAPLVNQPDSVNEAPLPLPPPIQNPPPHNNMAQAQALTDTANAINALAVALGQAMAYMKDNAQEWASSLANAPNHFQHDNHGQNDQN